MRRRPMMAALVALMMSGCGKPYATSVAETTALDGETLRVVVEVETGTSVTYPGPCPRTRTYPGRVERFEVRYDLSSREMPAPRVVRRPDGDLTPRAESPSDADRRTAREFGFSADVLLTTRSDSRVHESTPEGLAQDRARLEELGFDTGQPDFISAVDLPDGRWYLRTDSLSPCKVANPSKGVIRQANLDTSESYHDLIWDAGRSRLIVLHAKLDARVIGMPTSATVWDYAQGTRKTVNLPRVDPSDLK